MEFTAAQSILIICHKGNKEISKADLGAPLAQNIQHYGKRGNYCILIHLPHFLYIYQQYPIMSRQNSIEKRLLENVTSLKKTMVDCDINGWMETNRKQQPSPKNKIFFRPKIRQKSTSNIQPIQLETINDETERDGSIQRLIFEKKEHTKTCSTHCSNRINKISLLQNHPININEETPTIPQLDIAAKPFNSGYVLKELRKRVKQRSFLKKFNPNPPNERLVKSNIIQQLDTKNSIRYFQTHIMRLELLSSRGVKASRG